MLASIVSLAEVAAHATAKLGIGEEDGECFASELARGEDQGRDRKS